MSATLTIGKRRARSPSESGSTRAVSHLRRRREHARAGRAEPMNNSADTRASALSRVLRSPVVTAKKLARVLSAAVERFFADQCAARGRDRVSGVVLDRAAGDRARLDLRARA